MTTAAFMVGHIPLRMVLWDSLSSWAASLLPAWDAHAVPHGPSGSHRGLLLLCHSQFLLDSSNVLVTGPCVPQTPGTLSQRPHGSLEVPSLA